MNIDLTTERAVQELLKAWHDPKATIIIPRDCKIPVSTLDKTSKEDIEVTGHLHQSKSRVWYMTAHNLFKFGVVLNKHGYFVQQLAFDTTTEEARGE